MDIVIIHFLYDLPTHVILYIKRVTCPTSILYSPTPISVFFVIFSYCLLCHLISFHPIPPHPIPSHLSHLIPSHPISSHLSHLIPSHLIFLISSHPIPSHPIPSHLISSHLEGMTKATVVSGLCPPSFSTALLSATLLSSAIQHHMLTLFFHNPKEMTTGLSSTRSQSSMTKVDWLFQGLLRIVASRLTQAFTPYFIPKILGTRTA